MRGSGGMWFLVMTEHRWAGALLLSQLGLARAWWRGHCREKERNLRDRRAAAELEAYTRCELRLSAQQGHDCLATQICRLIAGQRQGAQVAVLGRAELDGGERGLKVLSSARMDQVTVSALNAWARRIQGERRSRPRAVMVSQAERMPLTASGEGGSASMGAETRSFEITLGPALYGLIGGGPKGGDLLRLGRATVVPCWGAAGRMLGALVLSEKKAGRYRWTESGGGTAPVWEGVAESSALEMLAERMARRIEASVFLEKLMEAERMASLGQIARGVAHLLNNPLTAVLGFSELIAETAEQPRVQKDAETITQEARRMREAVQRLLNFSWPGISKQEPLNIKDLLGEMAEECRGRLEARGIQLKVEAEALVPLVRGNKDRLRQVLEHLLNNASQAIATAQMRAAGLWDEAEEHAIRVSITQDRGMLQLLVSDTGVGFCEPARIFDPYHTAQQVSEGAGLGLSISYAIVREHGGEISAFNLQPRGACVVVELPLVWMEEEAADRAVA